MTVPRYIDENESHMRGIQFGWYAIEDDGVLSSGPFSNREAVHSSHLGQAAAFDGAQFQGRRSSSSTGIGVSSANSVRETKTFSASLAWSGFSHQTTAPPTQLASVEPSRSTPCRAKIWLCR
jgi:hypothetical protein